jgi:hypothetical protein
MKAIKIPEMIKIREAVRLTGLSRQAIYNYVHAGAVGVDADAYKYGVIMIDKDDLLRTFEERAERRAAQRAQNPGRPPKGEGK